MTATTTAQVTADRHREAVDGGRIAEQVVFCAGVWDPQLQARMVDEAPLIRP